MTDTHSSLPKALVNVRRHPSMYLIPCTVEALWNYVSGFYSGAGDQETLRQFHGYAGEQIGGQGNLAWPVALRRLREPQLPAGKEGEDALLEEAFSLLESFLDDRERDA